MDKADCVVVNLEQFGKDTAAEIGYSYGIGKPVVGFTAESHYENDTMVRGFLITVARDETTLVEVVKQLLYGECRCLFTPGIPVANSLPKFLKTGI
jgi:nucleoside 2-deoxyribosyltransferase